MLKPKSPVPKLLRPAQYVSLGIRFADREALRVLCSHLGMTNAECVGELIQEELKLQKIKVPT